MEFIVSTLFSETGLVALLYLVLSGLYLVILPALVYFYLKSRWYVVSSVERLFMYFLVFFFFPGMLLLSPVLNFRIDAIALISAFFVSGLVVYFLLQVSGLDPQKAGIWSQAFLVGVLILWLFTYIFRVLTNDMTYHKQIKDYEEAVIQKRWESMTPEEQAKLQAEVEQEKLATQQPEAKPES
jgi:signal transduction histidine kinase